MRLSNYVWAHVARSCLRSCRVESGACGLDHCWLSCPWRLAVFLFKWGPHAAWQMVWAIGETLGKLDWLFNILLLGSVLIDIFIRNLVSTLAYKIRLLSWRAWKIRSVREVLDFVRSVTLHWGTIVCNLIERGDIHSSYRPILSWEESWLHRDCVNQVLLLVEFPATSRWGDIRVVGGESVTSLTHIWCKEVA